MHAIRIALPLILLAAIARAADAPATRPAGDVRSAPMIVRTLLEQVGTANLDPMAEQIAKMGDPVEAPDAMKQAAAWAKANRESFSGVSKAPLPATPWGVATLRAAEGDGPVKLYLHVLDWHASGKAIVYGLDGGNVKRAYRLAEPKVDLAIEKTDRDTLVTVAKGGKAPDAIDTVVVVELAGAPKIGQLAIGQAADGSFLLHSKESIVVGRNLRYEPDPHKNTCGYWTEAGDWVYWEFDVKKAGVYDVELLQGCGKGSGGSEIDVVVGKQVLPMTVQDTGGFQNFVPRAIGHFNLDAGVHRLEVRVRAKKGVAVMDVRQIVLKPAAG